MHTRIDDRRHWTVEEVRAKLSSPVEIVIDGAVAYWLEDDGGRRLSPDSTRTIVPFARALEVHRMGTDPDTMRLWARLDDGRRYEVGRGIILIGMAEAAARGGAGLSI